ncbi:MAG: hypothetical protein JWO67_6781 [Streptosporangiaceae bacterium]|jgi:hypothetical protein|nr:hypothetical protein [Streptosporangiaceae bacterium]
MTTPPSFSPFVYARAIRAPDLPPIARHVALTLTSYANRSGDAWPAQETLGTAPTSVDPGVGPNGGVYLFH